MRNFQQNCPLKDRESNKDYFDIKIFESLATGCAVGRFQNFQIKNFKTHLRGRECVGGTQFHHGLGVIEYALSDELVRFLIRQLYKFPVLFRTGAVNLKLF